MSLQDYVKTNKVPLPMPKDAEGEIRSFILHSMHEPEEDYQLRSPPKQRRERDDKCEKGWKLESNKDIVAQIIYASIIGDLVLASAYAHELPHYGLEVGLTNYAADCMHNFYSYFGQATREDFFVEPAESRRPFRALLDVGLVRTTTGNRVFGALKRREIQKEMHEYIERNA
ncbi:hypothetical protein Cni_G16619 [Canna indica]|uniref:Uncharacterized protein n=1 Tax=Canna indica TaxID=4628 RepID=A0AAQ3KFK2_9LILI|nr:hypothetical protein Cni_G16619 [Canna indica]